MSLKGFEWLINNKVVMSFRFKDLTLYIWQKVSSQDLSDFKKYIKDNGFDISYYNYINKNN